MWRPGTCRAPAWVPAAAAMHSAGCLARCQGRLQQQQRGEDCRRSLRAHCQQGACRPSLRARCQGWLVAPLPCLLALCLLLWMLLLVWVLTVAVAAGKAGVADRLLQQARSSFLPQLQQQGLELSLLLQSVRLTIQGMQQVTLQQQQRVAVIRQAGQWVLAAAPGFNRPLQAASTAPL